MPEGWVAKFDDRYQRFYYVNIATKKSQWDKPPGTVDAPVLGQGNSVSSKGDRPPSYGDERASSPRPRSIHSQREEFITKQPIQSPSQFPQPTQPQCLSASQPAAGSGSPSRGIASRLSSFLKPRSPKPDPNYQQQYYGTQQTYDPQQGYYPQQGRPVYVQSSGPAYVQEPPRRSGLGVGGAAALGVGGGLLGGFLLADALEDHDDSVYQQGFDNGADYGDGDFGGGDF
jgi:hypothetical protein